MKFTNKDISVDTDTKIIKVFDPKNYSERQLYTQIVDLWAKHTNFSKYLFPLEYVDTLKLENGWKVSAKDTKMLMDNLYVC